MTKNTKLQIHGKSKPITTIGKQQRCSRHIVFCGIGTGKNICTACSYCSTRHNIPSIVFLGIYSTPRHIRCHSIGRRTPSPPVSTLQICRAGKSHARMVRRKRMIIACIGTFLMYGIFKRIRSCHRQCTAFCQLPKALVVAIQQRDTSPDSTGQEHKHVGRCLHCIATLRRRLWHTKQEQEEYYIYAICSVHIETKFYDTNIYCKYSYKRARIFKQISFFSLACNYICNHEYIYYCK